MNASGSVKPSKDSLYNGLNSALTVEIQDSLVSFYSRYPLV
jgi:hypothetical protein